jgi:formate hydrogenlyase transcriptional activator
MLVEYFVKRYAEKARKQITKDRQEYAQAMPVLSLARQYSRAAKYRREIRHPLHRGYFSVDEAWLSSQNAPRPKSSGLLTETSRAYEKELIEAALAESNGKVAGPNGAAAKLGIPRSTLDLKIKQLNIKKHTIR